MNELTHSVLNASVHLHSLDLVIKVLKWFVLFPAGRWIEDHGVVHNMMFNSTTLLKLTHKATLKRSEWWDNGVLPLWITAQNQVGNFPW